LQHLKGGGIHHPAAFFLQTRPNGGRAANEKRSTLHHKEADMVKVGDYNTLKVVKMVEFGAYLDGGDIEILLPNRYVPKGLDTGDEITVFIYHDNEQRLIATTAKPFGVVGDIVMLEVVNVASFGAFVRWGIMKDLLVPVSQQEQRMKVGDKRFVKIYIDQQTGRAAATEKIDRFLSNFDLTVEVNEPVDLVIVRKTEIGWVAIINNKHMGLLHFDEVFRELEVGEKTKGFIKNIRPDNKIDLAFGTRGYSKVVDDESRIMNMLRENGGFLPYSDKSDPETIYRVFGISKKTFKMILGALYKKRSIVFADQGVRLVDAPKG
jgi:uncharacterized protein